MADSLQKIAAFLREHHVLTLATSHGELPQCCNLFYTYLEQTQCFAVASDAQTEHMRNVSLNSRVAGTVVLETAIVGKIQGVQFTGVMREASAGESAAYFKAFPYALAMNPTLWCIELQQVKLTDNRLGFGKKLKWEREAE